MVVSYKNRTVVNAAFGKANTQANIPASTSKLHRIASISKVFTKVAIKHLISQARLSLDTKVFQDVFNYPSSQGSEHITVGDLLDHMVGCWPTTTRAEDPVFQKQSLTALQLMKQTVSETDFTKDRKFLYSNFGYLVLGRLIEHVTGLPYLSYIKQLFSAISVYQASNRVRPDETHYYSASSQDDCYNMPLHRMDSCAGLLATPVDLVKFLQLYCGDSSAE